MVFDVYCPPPTSKEIDNQRTNFKSQLKKARFFSVLLFAAWGVGIGFLWKLNFAPQNVIFGIAGAMAALVAICRILGGVGAAVAAAACVMAALASTIAVVAGTTYQNNLPLAIYAGLGGGFLLGGLCMLVGSRLRLAQQGLRPLKPVSAKKKAYTEAVELSKKHPVLDAYMSQITVVDRPLLKGEIETMKAWAARASRMSAAAAVPPEPPKAEEPASVAAEVPAPRVAETGAEVEQPPEKETPSVIELPGPEAEQAEPSAEEPGEPPKPSAGEPEEEKVIEAEILPEEKDEKAKKENQPNDVDKEK